MKALNGTWIPLKQLVAGKELPTTGDQRLVTEADQYTFFNENVDKGKLTYQNGRMDIFGESGPNKGNHIKAVYELLGEKLIVCYNMLGNGYPEDLNAGSEAGFSLCIYEKLEKK